MELFGFYRAHMRHRVELAGHSEAQTRRQTLPVVKRIMEPFGFHRARLRHRVELPGHSDAQNRTQTLPLVKRMMRLAHPHILKNITE